MKRYTLRWPVAEDYSIRIGGFLLSMFLFWIVNYLFKFGFGASHYIIFGLIATAGILLSPLYYVFKHYDKILHFLSPFLLSFLVFFLLDKLPISLYIKLFLTFSLTMLFVTLMEIGEYIIDKTLGWDLQGVYARNRSGTIKMNMIQEKIDDAMQDIIFGILGSLTFIILKLLFKI